MMLFDEPFGSENEHFESMRMRISLDRDFTKRIWETLPRKTISNLQKTGIALNSSEPTTNKQQRMIPRRGYPCQNFETGCFIMICKWEPLWPKKCAYQLEPSSYVRVGCSNHSAKLAFAIRTDPRGDIYIAVHVHIHILYARVCVCVCVCVCYYYCYPCKILYA